VTLGSIAVAALIATALAARQLPPDARFTEDAVFDYPYVTVGGNTLRLAVGGKIYNQRNMIITPTSAPSTAAALYKTDFRGEISQVWILTDEEAADYARNPPKSSGDAGAGGRQQ